MSKKPTHLLKVKERDGEGRCTIGVGWANDDGSISIALHPCVTLTSKDNVMINLFPVEMGVENEAWSKRKKSGTVIPEEDSEGHKFVEVSAQPHAGRPTSIQKCTVCKTIVAVNIPYEGVSVATCPGKPDGG